MPALGFNPAMEMSQLRTQQTLAMSTAGPAAAAAPAATAPVSATDPAAAMAASAGATGAAGEAAMGAMAVQEPPKASSIILKSVLRGAMTGASVTLGLKQFGPLLGKVGFISSAVGKLPVGGVAGAGLLGFLGRLPLLGALLPKVGGALRLGGFQGILVAAAMGAGVGAIFGAVSGMRKAKAAAAEYADAMAKAQAEQPPVGNPVNADAPPVGAEPGPAPAPVKPKYRSWVVARTGSTARTGGSFGHYATRKGDTLDQLAKRFHTTPAEIRKLNPGVGSTLEPGTKLKLKRKVVPDAVHWKHSA